MLDWLKSLTPETIIIFGALLSIFTMTIFTLIRLRRIASRVGEQECYINESLLEIDGQPYINLTIINKAFSTNHINVVGVELRNISHPIEEKVVMIAPRSKHQTRFNLNDLKPIIFQSRKKYRPFKIYVENEIGLRKSMKPKVNNKFMKRQFKKLQKAEKLEKKRLRYESGQYNFMERTGLIIGLLFRPFIKLKRHMALSTNKALRESEIRRMQKKEHDAIKYKLDQDEFELSEIRIREQAIKENRTRELELESLKKSKELEIETIKQQTREAEFLAAKADLEAINPEAVAKAELQKEKSEDAQDKKKKTKKTKSQSDQDEPVEEKAAEPVVETVDEPFETEPVLEEKPKKTRSKKKKVDVEQPQVDSTESTDSDESAKENTATELDSAEKPTE